MKPTPFALSLLLAAAGFALPAHAVGSLADVTVIDRQSGATLPVYHHRGEYWVAGQYGAKYAVLVRNRLGERVLAVTAVDGVNVLSGETAAWDQTGYVFSPWQQYQVTGWRKSDREVAAFEFSASGESYAGRTGRPGHVGVIGVALFRERMPAPVLPLPEYSRRDESRDPSRDLLREESALPRARSAPAPAAPPAENSTGLADRNSAEASSREQAQRGAASSDSLAKAAPSFAPRPAPQLGTAHGQREKIANHLILLAKDEEGYSNLRYLASTGYLHGFYYHPRIDKKILKERSFYNGPLDGDFGKSTQTAIRKAFGLAS